MPSRTGRPKAEKPKTIEVKARIDEETNKKLSEYCRNYCISRTNVVRKGIDTIFESGYLGERRRKMKSFKDIQGKDIPFENINELVLELQTDIETNEITAYLVYKGDYIYEVNQSTYEAIESKK